MMSGRCGVLYYYSVDHIVRIMRELEAVKQEAGMLQEQMKMVKYDIQKVKTFSLQDLSMTCIIYHYSTSSKWQIFMCVKVYWRKCSEEHVNKLQNDQNMLS